MKTKMNIICILIFVSIIASFVEFYINSGGEAWADIRRGAQDGWNSPEYEGSHIPADTELYRKSSYLNIRPKDYSVFSDSVFNEATGKWMPAQYRGTLIVENEVEHEFGLEKAFIGLSSFIIFIAAIILFIAFIRLILKINKSIIFHWTNVHKLRWIGVCMLVMFASFGLAGWLNYTIDRANIDLPDYVISSEGIWNFSLLISGLGVLLIAEIFAIGLRLQEEQELTI